MTFPDPAAFVTDWIEAWNRLDVEAVLAHFHEDALFSSPLAQRLLGANEAVVQGKPAIRSYWQQALQVNEELHFTLESYSVGIDIIVIQFRNQDDILRNEVLVFDGDRVRFGYGTFPAELVASAGIVG